MGGRVCVSQISLASAPEVDEHTSDSDMPSDEIDNDGEPSRATVEMFECPMCHQRVPLAQSITIGGRRLCFGCASDWFDDEEDKDKT